MKGQYKEIGKCRGGFYQGETREGVDAEEGGKEEGKIILRMFGEP